MNEFCLVVNPAGQSTVCQEFNLQSRTLGQDLLNLPGVLHVRYDHLELALVNTVLQIVRSKNAGGRTENCTNLNGGNRKGPPFRNPRQHNHYPVALADVLLEHHICNLIGQIHHVAEGKVLLLPFLIRPDHGELVSVFLRPCIDYVESEVVVLRHGNRKRGIGFLVICHIV